MLGAGTLTLHPVCFGVCVASLAMFGVLSQRPLRNRKLLVQVALRRGSVTLGPAASLREGASGDRALTWVCHLRTAGKHLPLCRLPELMVPSGTCKFDSRLSSWVERGFVRAPEYCWALLHRLVGPLCFFFGQESL